MGSQIQKNLSIPNSIYTNLALLEFRRQADHAVAVQKMDDGVVDEFEDESGVDTPASINEQYDSTNDLYSSALPLDSNYKYYLKLNGDLVDSSASPMTITNNGTTSDTTNKVLGSGSRAWASGQYFNIPDFTYMAGTASWTWARYVRFTTDQDCVFDQQGGGSSDYVNVRYSASAHTLQINAISSNSTVLALNIPFTPSLNTWYHIAFSRNGTTEICGFIDGVKKTVTFTTGSASTSIPNISAAINVGYRPWAADLQFLGQMDNMEFSDVCRYTSSFTPPSIEYGTAQNMTLISQSQTADAAPSTSKIIVFEEDVDAVTLNTDLEAYVSRDGGTTWTQATLSNVGLYETGKNILIGSVDISGQPSGTSMKWKLVTANSKNLKIHGVALIWQ